MILDRETWADITKGFFEEKLRKILDTKPFDSVVAEELSKQIHIAEEEGYKVSESEDELWEELTFRVWRGD